MSAKSTAHPPALKDDSIKCLPIFEAGIKTGDDFCLGMGALMADLAASRIKESIGNAICNAGGKILKTVELNLRHGTKGDNEDLKTLRLIR